MKADQRLRYVAIAAVMLTGFLVEAAAGVYLTSYSFTADNLPHIYTNESLPEPYRLRAKITGNYHATNRWNNQDTPLESVPGTGFFTVELYWVRYASDLSTILEVGPFNPQTIVIQAPNAGPVPAISVDGYTPGTTVTRPYNGSTSLTVRYSASDANGNLSGIRYNVWNSATGYFDNGGGGYAAQSGYGGQVVRTVDLNRDGDWYFWSDAIDTGGAATSTGAWGAGLRLTVQQPPQTDFVSATSALLGQSTTITGRASDPNSNLQSLSFYVNPPDYSGWILAGSVSVNGSNATGSAVWPIPAQGQTGTYLVTVRAKDAAGQWDWNGNAISTFTVSSAQPPVLSTQPSSQIVNAGQAATFAVAASGTAPLSYQWRKNSAIISGATGSTYGIASAQTSDAATYSAVVSNSAGSTTSNGASLTVTPPQPIRLAVKYWQADDYPGITVYQYQEVTVPAGWVDDWEYVDDEWVSVGTHWEEERTESQYVAVATYPDGMSGSTWTTTGGTFDIASAASGYSTTATNRGSFVHSYPVGALVTVHVFGAAPSANCNNFDFKLYNPAGVLIASTWFNPSFAWSFYAYAAGYYRVDVSYLYANAIPPTGTISYYIPVGVAPPPTILGQPTPVTQTVASGTSVTYSVNATGATSYQWVKDGAAISGANSATLTLANVQAAHGGTYAVIVSNSAGSVNSTTVGLTVSLQPPTLTTQPASQTVNAGQLTTFSVAATGSVPLTYQWRKNGTAISGASAAILALPNAQSGDAGAYSVVVSNSAGSATSNAATLTVNLVAPTLTTQASSQTVNVGQSVTFAVTAAGTAPLSYQWRKNGATIGAATGASYGIASAQTSDAATYSVLVSNSVGSIASANATLVVNTTPPIRLALEYWQSGDYPDRAIGEHEEYGWIDGHYDSQWNEETGEYEDVWIDGQYGSYMVTDYASDGLYGSRWDTTTGTFGYPLAYDTGAYNATAANRGYLLNAYPVNFAYIAFRVWAYAPGKNCSNYSAVLYNPSGGTISSGTFTSGSYAYFSFPDWIYGTGAYRVDLTYSGATATNPASGTVSYYIPVGTSAPPAITTPPQARTVQAGQNVSFTVLASGTAPLTYQWRKGGVAVSAGGAISGATSPTLTLTGTTVADAGGYDVVVSNGGGSTASATATLTVNAPGDDGTPQLRVHRLP